MADEPHKCFGFVILLILVFRACNSSLSNKPNIIFILTDDQDVDIGGMTPMKKTRQLLGSAGMTFQNMFTSSPLCCPSRSSILTGRYTHNYQAVNNTIHGNCSSPSWQANHENKAFPVHLKSAGYQTFFAGKYLNQYGHLDAGGVSHVPPGWDHWYGLVGNSVYYNFTLSVNGVAENHGDHYPDDYLTSIIGKIATEFLSEPQIKKEPFFMMLSTPACHAPFTPAPQYKTSFKNISAPRDGSFNYYGKDKHWLVRAAKHPLSKEAITYIDETYRNRWRTLLTVDDIVESVINNLEEKHLLNNTYIFYSSDNGYHLGQFSLPNDKRQLYDFDIHVPLIVRGPGVKAGNVRKEIAMNIDLAPTFLDLAGITPPTDMDGRSLKPILLSSSSALHGGWREDFIVEHYGEYQESVPGCPQYNHQNLANCEIDCVCEDARNNTYACLRRITTTENFMYCQFSDSEGFVEAYNLTNDPHQLLNIANSINPKILVPYSNRLIELAVCSGDDCRKSQVNWGYTWWQNTHSKRGHHKKDKLSYISDTTVIKKARDFENTRLARKKIL